MSSSMATRSSKKAPDTAENFADILNEFRKDFDSIKTDLASVRQDLTALLEKKDEKIRCMNDVIVKLQGKVKKLEDHIEEQNVYDRRDAIVISGNCLPEVVENENCTKLVEDIVKNKLKVNIRTSDISTAHRLGKKKRWSC